MVCLLNFSLRPLEDRRRSVNDIALHPISTQGPISNKFMTGAAPLDAKLSRIERRGIPLRPALSSLSSKGRSPVHRFRITFDVLEPVHEGGQTLDHIGAGVRIVKLITLSPHVTVGQVSPLDSQVQDEQIVQASFHAHPAKEGPIPAGT